jgi:hypothetical protein
MANMLNMFFASVFMHEDTQHPSKLKNNATGQWKRLQ